MVTATRQISRAYWWSLVIRAIVALLFGIAAFISPLFAGLFLIYLFGAYALLDGILAVNERGSSGTDLFLSWEKLSEEDLQCGRIVAMPGLSEELHSA